MSKAEMMLNDTVGCSGLIHLPPRWTLTPNSSRVHQEKPWVLAELLHIEYEVWANFKENIKSYDQILLVEWNKTWVSFPCFQINQSLVLFADSGSWRTLRCISQPRFSCYAASSSPSASGPNRKSHPESERTKTHWVKKHCWKATPVLAKYGFVGKLEELIWTREDANTGVMQYVVTLTMWSQPVFSLHLLRTDPGRLKLLQ